MFYHILFAPSLSQCTLVSKKRFCSLPLSVAHTHTHSHTHTLTHSLKCIGYKGVRTNASYQWKWNKKEFHFCFISDVTILSFSLVYKRKERLVQQHHSLPALSWDFKWNKVFDFQQKFLVSVLDSYFLISTMAKVRRIRFKSWQGLNMKFLGTMYLCQLW